MAGQWLSTQVARSRRGAILIASDVSINYFSLLSSLQPPCLQFSVRWPMPSTFKPLYAITQHSLRAASGVFIESHVPFPLAFQGATGLMLSCNFRTTMTTLQVALKLRLLRRRLA